MSAIVNLGQIQISSPTTTPKTTWERAMNKFEVLSKEIFFGPGMVTRLTHCIYESLFLVNECYRKNEEVPRGESGASFLLHSIQTDSSRENSHIGSDSDTDPDPHATLLLSHPESLAHLFMQNVYSPPA